MCNAPVKHYNGRCIRVQNAPLKHCVIGDASGLYQPASECVMQAVKHSDCRCNRMCRDVSHGCSWICADTTDAWLTTTWVLFINYPTLSSLCRRRGVAPLLLWWPWTQAESPIWFTGQSNQTHIALGCHNAHFTDSNTGSVSYFCVFYY